MTEHHDSTFIPLHQSSASGTRDHRPLGMVIKASNTRIAGSAEIHVEDASQPQVHLKRSGDDVVAVEFHCPCGKHTTVTLDYEQKDLAS